MKHHLGIFDSGVGGLTVLKTVLSTQSNLRVTYLADIARLPYGNKSPEEIRLIAEEVINWLQKNPLTGIIVACNTTNSLALDIVKKLSKVPIFTLVDSAVDMIKENRVGIIATESTVSSAFYSTQILNSHNDISVFEKACPEFVPLIEAGKIGSDDLNQCVKEYLEPLLNENVQSIVLGCSHYPLIENILNDFLPSNIRLINPAIGLSEKLDKYFGMSSEEINFSANLARVRFCTTSEPIEFINKIDYWLGIRPHVENVSLQSRACVF